MVLLIDNYDSFTWNIAQYLGELGADVQVHRNDEITLDEIASRAPAQIVISPGPCTPDQAGISMAVVERFGGDIPILGVCLGHQSIGQVFGGAVVRSPTVVHGKVSTIHHYDTGVFVGLPNPFEATRYHSLILDQADFPDSLEITAWTRTEQGEIDVIMGIRHRHLAIEGVQFHPESLMTPCGHALLANFLRQSGATVAPVPA